MSRPLSVAALRSAEPPAAVEAALPALLAAAEGRAEPTPPAGVQALKDGAVWRVGSAVVKLYPRAPGPLARLRPTRAARAAAAHARLLPVRSPRPLHWRPLARPTLESLLVYEHVEGDTLTALRPDPPAAARDSLPLLFAALHSRRILHGDLHGGNLLWDGAEWCVLDLDGLRHRLHWVRHRAVTEKVWARLLLDLGDPAAGEALYRRFLAASAAGWDANASWRRIRVAYDARHAHRATDASPT